MYQAGASLAGVARAFNVSRNSIWDLLRRRITLRPQKRIGKDNHFYRNGLRANDQAQNLLEQAIEDGVVQKRAVCEQCGAAGTFRDGRSAIQAHHDDYTKPLEVRWLCQKCHHAWHKINQAVGAA